MKLIRSCRDVTRLVLQGEDTRLSLSDRLRVRLHLSVCQGCTNFVSQVGVMRQSMRRWRAYSESDTSDPRNERDA